VRGGVVTAVMLVQNRVGDVLTTSIASGVFAVASPILAALGTFSVVTHVVTSRTRAASFCS
jgi:hypothetical protein